MNPINLFYIGSQQQLKKHIQKQKPEHFKH